MADSARKAPVPGVKKGRPGKLGRPPTLTTRRKDQIKKQLPTLQRDHPAEVITAARLAASMKSPLITLGMIRGFLSKKARWVRPRNCPGLKDTRRAQRVSWAREFLQRHPDTQSVMDRYADVAHVGARSINKLSLAPKS